MQKLLAICGALSLLISIPILWISRREGPRIDPPSVLAQVQRLNHLATVKYTIQKVIGLTEQKKPVGSESALDMGILHQAEVNAETSIRSLLGLAGVKRRCRSLPRE